RKSAIKIGIIAVPEIAAQHVLDIMISAGIKGVLNFAPIQLRGGQDVVVKNINLALELENIIYFVNLGERGEQYPDENTVT
ncbi:MAG: redox-sensing transcriptional repressor Rex, partial [Candidatus Omnitrophota bacterium]